VSEAREIEAALGRPCPATVLCVVLGAPRSSFYAAARGDTASPPPRKRGPKTVVSDEDLIAAIREVHAESSFHGEGYKKAHSRLRRGRWNLRVGKNRVLRLSREAGLLAPVRRRNAHGNKAHDGRIVTDRPNEMWGADATTFWTEEEGLCWFFGASDHFNAECVGWTVRKVGDRWAAIDSLRSGVCRVFGKFDKDIARGVRIRHDWGSQYTSRDFQADIRYAGLQSTPAYVGEPETNGVIERFMRTLKDQCLHQHRFRSVEEARGVIAEFIERYNNEWILERLGYRTPVEARAEYNAALAGKAA